MKFVFPKKDSAEVGYSDYISPEFLAIQADKIYAELIRVFSPLLRTLPKMNPVCQFLAQKGLYLGPYLGDDLAGGLSKKAELFAQSVQIGQPSYTAYINPDRTLGKKPFVPGMCMHDFNNGAARLWHGREQEGIPQREYVQGIDAVDAILINTRILGRASKELSAAIAEMDLNMAMHACFPDEWGVAGAMQLRPDILPKNDKN